MLRPNYYETLPLAIAYPATQFIEWLTPQMSKLYPATRASSTPSEVFREFSFNFQGQRYYDMARKSASTAATSTPKTSKQTQWANIRLQDDDTPLIVERANDGVEIIGGLFKLFDAGYDIFIKRRDDGKTVSISAVGRSTRDRSQPIGVSAYAPDIFVAASALLFKYYDIAGGVLEDYVGTSSGGIG